VGLSPLPALPETWAKTAENLEMDMAEDYQRKVEQEARGPGAS